jgi:hypothetical protein
VAKTRKADSQHIPFDSTHEVIGALLRGASSFEQSLKVLTDAAKANDAAAQANAFRETRTAIESLAGLSERLAGEVNRAVDQSERQFLELEVDLRNVCRQKGWRVDGQWPTFYIERGVAVTVDTQKRVVSVAQQRLRVCTAGAIAAALEPLVQGLIPRKFDAERFVAHLAKAYDDVRGNASQVPIFAVYRAFVIASQSSQFWRDARSDAFVGVSVSAFRSRVSAALESGATRSADGRELRLLPALNPNDGLFLYQPAEARFGFVGRIEFVSPSLQLSGT